MVDRQRVAPADAAVTTGGADVRPPDQKSGFTLPSAYTILFALIVLAAIATWIPAGTRSTTPIRASAKSSSRSTGSRRPK
jgi:hypothetical protein